MRNILTIAFFILLFHTRGSAQINDARILLMNQIAECLAADFSKLNDSIEVHGFSIVVDLKKSGKKSKVIGVDVNDSTAKSVLKDFHRLHKLDYSFFNTGNKTTKMIIPVLMVRFNSYDKKSISKLYKTGFTLTMNLLFNFTDETQVFSDGSLYIKPFIIYLDKSQYDD